jgi:hypothetical protein
LSLVSNSNSILLYHLLRTLNQNQENSRTRRTQIAKIHFFSNLFFWILFSASLVLIISLILFMTYLIHLLLLKVFNFLKSNKFISSFFFVHLQFESIQTERKTENSFITPCHFIVDRFQQKWLLLYALGEGSSLVDFCKVEPTTFHPVRAVVLLGSTHGCSGAINKDRVRDHPGAVGGAAPPPLSFLFSFSSI